MLRHKGTADTTRMDDSGPERRILLLTASLQLHEAAQIELAQLVTGQVDWRLLINQSMVHGTAGLLYKHFCGLKNVSMPSQVMEDLRQANLMMAASTMNQLGYFSKVARDLNAQKIDFITLKGANLGLELYGGLSLRPISDVDLLVKEEDWERIRPILARHGLDCGKDFSQLPPKLTKYDIQSHIQYFADSGVCLEFQFDLFTLGIGMRDIAGVWSRSRQSSLDWGGLVLSPEDEILQLVIHANRHGCAKLKWMVDIAESLRRSDCFDWDLLAELVERENLKTSVYATLSHVEELFDVRLVPEQFMSRIRPRRYQQALWRAVWPKDSLAGFTGRYEDAITFYFYRVFSGWNLINFAIMGRTGDKMAYQLRFIAPSLTWLSKSYGQPKSLALLRYYPIRFFSRRTKKAKNDSR